MAGWLEGIEEAAFRPAPGGGHVFMSPHPWLLARPRYYLVNDAQKAAIGQYVRKRARLALLFAPIAIVLIALFAILLVYGGLPRLPPILVGIAFAAVLVLPMLIVPHVYFMRMVGPIVKDLPLTDQKFTTREQFSSVAKAMPNWLVYGGMVGGVLMIVGAMMSMYDLLSAGRPAVRWISPIISMTGGVLFVAYFAYLANLKKKATKAS